LVGAGHEVFGIDRAPYVGPETAEFIRADLLNPQDYESWVAAADLVCHLAAAKGDWGISKEEYFRDNVEATRSLIDVMRRVGTQRCVFYSTVSVLGPSTEPVAEDASGRPVNPYGESKAECERLFERFVEEDPLSHIVTIRPSVVFGPENPWNTNIFRLIDAIHRGRFLMIGRGREVKTTSYIDNLLDAHMFLMQQEFDEGKTGQEIFHYVDAPGETTSTLVNLIRHCLGKKANTLHLPLAIASPLALVGDAAAALTGIDVPITSARVRKFCTATNFAAAKIRTLGYQQAVTIEEAIGQTVDWYLGDYLNSSGARS
jgi:nucleoside-diphosphate-sugar epimerase